MLEQYEEYFRQRMEMEAPFPILTPERLNLIREFFPPQANWRSDAGYFLIGVLHSMLLAPLSEAGPEYREINGYVIPDRIDRSEFFDALRADIRSVVELSNSIARARGRAHVSSTSVAMAIGQLAPELRTSAFQVWGPENPEPAATAR